MTSDASPTSSDDDALAIGLLGDTLRRERHRRGWSVHVLSARAGVSFGLVSELERGKGNPSFRALRRLAEALELPLAKLVAADGDELLVRAGTGYRLPIDPGAPAQQRVERSCSPPGTSRRSSSSARRSRRDSATRRARSGTWGPRW